VFAPQLDGTCDREALSVAMMQIVLDGRLHLAQNGQSVTRTDEIRTALAAILNQALTNVAKQALLIS